MENTMYVALSRQSTLRRQMDVVANNLANMSTHGYKSGQMMFVEHLTKSKGGDNLLTPKLAYVRDIATMTDTKPGAIEHTGNPLDIAIQGDGYFVVQTPEGERYTRNGRLQLDNTGQLVNQLGQPVLADGGAPMVFAPEDTEIVVSKDGTVSTNNGELGKLRIVNFDNEQVLDRRGQPGTRRRGPDRAARRRRGIERRTDFGNGQHDQRASCLRRREVVHRTRRRTPTQHDPQSGGGVVRQRNKPPGRKEPGRNEERERTKQ